MLSCPFCLFWQATLGLALDILLSEENGWVVLQQGVGRLINAIVAVLGPELAPGSIFFSRCKVLVSCYSFSAPGYFCCSADVPDVLCLKCSIQIHWSKVQNLDL